MMPLSDFPREMREEIEYLVSLPKPPPKWKVFRDEDGRPLASIQSRAYTEWHLARGYSRNGRRSKIPPALRMAIIKRDGLLCRLCGGEVESEGDVDIDHIIPSARGGKTTADNLQVTHSSCNRRKGAREWPVLDS